MPARRLPSRLSGLLLASALAAGVPAIAADATKRANFAHACIQLCQQYNFDGIDIDWEYPGYTEHLGTTADKQNFTIRIFFSYI